MRGFGVKALAAAVAITLAASSAPFSTSAFHDVYFGSNWGHFCDRTPLSQCITNDNELYYGFGELSQTRLDAAQRAFLTYGVNSEINVHWSPATDVLVVQELRPDVNAFAWGQCAPSPVSVTWGGSESNHTRFCYPQYVYWNLWSAAASKVNTQARYWYIGCHEVGHPIGLRHRSTSPVGCMIPTSLPPSNSSSIVPSVTDPVFADFQRINAH